MNFRNFDFKNINIDFNKLGKKRTIYLIIFLLLVAVLAWAFITAGVITRNFNREQLVGTENRQELNISSLIITETKGEKKYWEIYGESGSYSSDNKVALLQNVVGNFYDDKNQVSMSFESSQGTYNEEKRQIILYKNTHIVIKDGTSLYCDRLVWSGSDKEIVAQGNIKIDRNNDLIATAQKAIISPDYSSFKIVGKTITKIYGLKEKK